MSLAQLAVGCLQYKPTVLLLTGVTASILAAVILYIQKLVLRQEDWARYFGWAFGVFGVQYLVQAACSWAENQDFYAAWKPALVAIEHCAHVLGSTTNTLLFLAAALALLGKLAEGKFVPKWTWAVAGFAACAELLGPNWYWRLPDATFSSVCLILLGLALFINFRQKNFFLASINLFGSCLYALLHIVYIFNPPIAASILWPELTEQLRAFKFPVDTAKGLLENRLAALDTLTLTVAFVFKLGLFLAGLLLIIKMLLILSPSVARGLFNNLASGRKHPQDQEIAKAVGESVEADYAALWIRWPRSQDTGIVPRGQHWHRPGSSATKVQPELAHDLMAREDGEVVIPFSKENPSTAIVLMPIRFHGAVIGCLQLNWHRRPGYTATALQRIRQLADLLSPLIDQVRQMIAVNEISVALHAVEETGAGLESLRQALEKLIPIVHRTLLPLATGCVIDLGFVHAWVVCNDREVESGDQESIKGEALDAKTIQATHLRGRGDIEFSKVNLRAHGIKIGDLVFAINRDRDSRTRPSLTQDPIHLETVASLLAEAILDTAHAEFGAVLAKLQLKLNSVRGNSAQSWFEATDAAARRVGIRWAVASLPQGDSLLGKEGLELVRDLESPGKRGIWEDVPELLVPLPQEEPIKGTCCVLLLKLPDSGARLWLGLGRWTGQELRFPSPWRRFLESLAQATDSALVRIERHRLQLEAKQLETVTMRVETAALMIHTLGNDAAALLNGTERLEEMLPPVGAPMNEDIRKKVEGIKTSAQSLQNLSKAFKQPVQSDGSGHVCLRDATEKIRALYEDTFKKKDIELEIDIPPDLFVSVPLEVVYLVLVMLTVNASEAIEEKGEKGRIRISAHNGDGKVCCSIEDSGPGIKKEDMAKIFDPGYSTKDGTGLGLPLARNSLVRWKGALELTSSQPGKTTFTAKFPV
jgi:signal transduction histidine kinase